MKTSSYYPTDIPHGSSCRGNNEQDTTEQEQPTSKKARVGPHSVSVINDLLPHFEMFSNDSPPQLNILSAKKTYNWNACGFNTLHKEKFTEDPKNYRRAYQQKSKYKCEICDFKTPNKNLLKIHLYNHRYTDKKDNKFNCKECVYNTDVRSNFTRHLKRHLRAKASATSPPSKIIPVTTAQSQTGHLDDKVYQTSENILKKCELKKDLSATDFIDQEVKKKVKIVGASTNNTTPAMAQTSHPEGKLHQTPEVISKEYELEKESSITGFTCQGFKNNSEITDSSNETNKNEDIPFTVVPATDTTLETTAMAQTTHLDGNHHQKPKDSSKVREPEKDNITDLVAKNKAEIAGSNTEANINECVQIIKVEQTYDNVFGLQHCINNRAPLWAAELAIKQEFTEIKKKQNKMTHTYFTDIDIEITNKAKGIIKKAISFYEGLNDEDRELYLNERMYTQKHDGSIFSKLKGQDEAVAARDLAQLEVLGHYAGMQYTETTYSASNAANSMGATRGTIDSYSIAITDTIFISGFRLGNVTSLINACNTYSQSEKNMDLPEENVSFLRYRDNQGKWIVFVIALKDIKANDQLWTDYGKEYWAATIAPIEIKGSKNAEQNK